MLFFNKKFNDNTKKNIKKFLNKAWTNVSHQSSLTGHMVGVLRKFPDVKILCTHFEQGGYSPQHSHSY
jgi:hypothetical protein